MEDYDDYTNVWQNLFVERDNLREKAYNKSVGRPKVKKGITKEGIVALALAVVIAISGISIASIRIKGKLERIEKISKASDVVKRDAQRVLLDNGLAEYDEKGNFVVKNNSTEDYEVLDLDDASFEELYAYFLVLDNGDQFDTFIRSVQGVDGAHNYIGASQFYSYNGFNGPEGGYVTFRQVAEDKLLSALDNGTITEVVKSQNLGDGRSR